MIRRHGIFPLLPCQCVIQFCLVVCDTYRLRRAVTVQLTASTYSNRQKPLRFAKKISSNLLLPFLDSNGILPVNYLTYQVVPFILSEELTETATMPVEYGLTDQMNKRIASKRDAGTELASLRWIFGILGEAVPEDQPLENVLHDGQVLARFMKKIRPDLLTQKINTNNIEASQRENIGNFIQAASKLGLRSYEIFQTNDLYDKKDIPQVGVCLSALGTKLQETNPDLPAFGPAPKHG